MGRPNGSQNRQKPFTDVLRVALLSGGGRRLRVIADKLVEKAEGRRSTGHQRGYRQAGQQALASRRARRCPSRGPVRR